MIVVEKGWEMFSPFEEVGSMFKCIDVLVDEFIESLCLCLRETELMVVRTEFVNYGLGCVG